MYSSKTESLNDRPSSPKNLQTLVEDRPYLVILETQGGLGAGRREQMLPAVVIRVQVSFVSRPFQSTPRYSALRRRMWIAPPAVAGLGARAATRETARSGKLRNREKTGSGNNYPSIKLPSGSAG